jgi:transcriptional regulator PpsR
MPPVWMPGWLRLPQGLSCDFRNRRPWLRPSRVSRVDSRTPPWGRCIVNGLFHHLVNPWPDAAGTVLDRVVQASADLALFVDPRGQIRDLYQAPDLSAEDMSAWIGRAWEDTVRPETRAKVGLLYEESRQNGVSRTRQINQELPSGAEIPVGFTAVCLDEGAGFVLLGRNLQSLSELQRRLVEAQQALERDYWRLRQMETRYRMLFQRSTEGLLVLDAGSRRILDSNRAAGQAFGIPPQKLTGRVFPDEMNLTPTQVQEVRRHLEGVRDQGSASTVQLDLSSAGWKLEASAIREEREGILLVHVREIDQRGPDQKSPPRAIPSAAHLLEYAPDPFIVMDRDARILLSNQAFRDLIQVTSHEEIRGQVLGQWLGRPGADMTVLMTNLEKFGEVRLFPTTLQSNFDMESEVEISATPVVDSDPPTIAVTFRNVSRRIWGDGGGPPRDLSRAVEQLTHQVGKVSLKQLVQDTVAVVEAHFIESALKLTDGNRTAAAEILGVSRQSLYTKLRRYDVEGSES